MLCSSGLKSRTLLMGMLSCKGSLVESDEDTNDKHARRLHTFGIYTWTRDLGGMKAFCVQSNKCTVQLAREMQIWCSNRLSEIWPTIASIMLWNILKSRCKVRLAGEESRPQKETMTTLWHDLITNIRAQYEELEGSSNMVEVASLSFQ